MDVSPSHPHIHQPFRSLTVTKLRTVPTQAPLAIAKRDARTMLPLIDTTSFALTTSLGYLHPNYLLLVVGSGEYS